MMTITMRVFLTYREALENEMNSQTGSVKECCAANLDVAVEAEKNPSSSPDLGYIISGTMADADVLKASLKEVAARPANESRKVRSLLLKLSPC